MAASRRPDLSRSQQLTGMVATLVNFPAVFVGLLAITVGAEGEHEIALLNLWAAWGIAQGLLGQIAQVSGVLDGRPWTDPRASALALPAAIATAVVTFALRGTLFPRHEWWWAATVVLVVAVVVIGRQRADLARRLDGTITLVIAAVESSVRSAAILVVVLIAADRAELFGWGAVAIVAPFLVSIALLSARLGETETLGSRAGRTAIGAPRSIGSGVLSGVPALAAYAVVPGLTLLDQTADLGAIAIAGSLLRGPLVITTFVAPVLLERWVVLQSGDMAPRAWMVPTGLVVIQALSTVLTEEGSTQELAVQTLLSGLVVGIGYLFILRQIGQVTKPIVPIRASVVAAIAFTVVLMSSVEVGWIHPFLSLSVACGAIAVLLARESRLSGSTA